MDQRFAAAMGVLLGLAVHSGAGALEVGAAAPACTLAPLGTSPASETRQLLGKVVYVDFWASWCVPCVKSFPFLNALERDYRERGLQVVAVDVDEHVEDGAGFLKQHEARFAVGSDARGACPKAFGLHGMPTSYLIDRKGLVRLVHDGFRDGDREGLRKKIEEVLAEDGQGAAAPASAPTAQHDMEHMDHMNHGEMNHMDAGH